MYAYFCASFIPCAFHAGEWKTLPMTTKCVSVLVILNLFKPIFHVFFCSELWKTAAKSPCLNCQVSSSLLFCTLQPIAAFRSLTWIDHVCLQQSCHLIYSCFVLYFMGMGICDISLAARSKWMAFKLVLRTSNFFTYRIMLPGIQIQPLWDGKIIFTGAVLVNRNADLHHSNPNQERIQLLFKL